MKSCMYLRTIRRVEKIKIKEVIVVEGRDDIDAVGKACDALMIATHGFGITKETWNLIEKAYKEKGIIILTDPDFSGEEIRKKLTAKFPDALQAYIPQSKAIKADDIGVENATPEDIAEALLGAKATSYEENGEITREDIVRLGLSGMDNSAEVRARVMDELGIGYGNVKSLIKKLNGFNISLETLEETVERVING